MNKKSSGIVGLIASGLLLAGTFGLATAFLPAPLNQQIEQNKLDEDYNTALMNYSREMYASGQTDVQKTVFASEQELYDFVKAYK